MIIVDISRIATSHCNVLPGGMTMPQRLAEAVGNHCHVVFFVTYTSCKIYIMVFNVMGVLTDAAEAGCVRDHCHVMF